LVYQPKQILCVDIIGTLSVFPAVSPSQDTHSCHGPVQPQAERRRPPEPLPEILFCRFRLSALRVVCQRRLVQPTCLHPQPAIPRAEANPEVCCRIRDWQPRVVRRPTRVVHHLRPKQAGLGVVWRCHLLQHSPWPAMSNTSHEILTADKTIKKIVHLQK